jgi:hypothetical protein
MNDARERMLDSPIYSDAIEHLIGKLLVPENLTSTAHKECLADMTTKFFDEHQKFVNQTGILNSDTMRYAAGKSDFVVACRWHHTWMLPRTKVLGKLACLVLSKILGIGIDRNCDVLPLSLDDLSNYSTLMLKFCTNKRIWASLLRQVCF